MTYYRLNEIPYDYLFDLQEYRKYCKEYDEEEMTRKLELKSDMIYLKKSFPQMFGYYIIEHIDFTKPDPIYGTHFIEITRWVEKYGHAEKI